MSNRCVVLLRLAVLSCLAPCAIAQQLITTVAGTGILFQGEGAPATQAALGRITELALDPQGRLIFADPYYHAVFRIEPDGTLKVLAGNHIAGYSGDGGPATLASLNSPKGVAVDSAGNLYISESDNYRVRRVTPDGIITTWAGTGQCDLRVTVRDNVPAVSEQLCQPMAIAADRLGNLYINDRGHRLIRRVTPQGTMSVWAGNGNEAFGGEMTPATQTPLGGVEGMAVDAQGNLYLAEFLAHRIRRVSTDGRIATVAGTGRAGYSGDGGPATAANLNSPGGVAIDSDGALLVMDSGNQRIRRVNSSGVISTVAGDGRSAFQGDGGPALRASFRNAFGLAASPNGDLWVADRDNFRVRRVAPGGGVSTVAGNGRWHALQEGRPAANSLLVRPFGLSLDSAGNLLIADQYDHLIRRMGRDGSMRLVAGSGALEASGDGFAATEAGLAFPAHAVADSDGRIYLADAASHTVRVVEPNGIIRRFAGNGVPAFAGDGGAAENASLDRPVAIAPDGRGAVYIADFGSGRIRRVRGGLISTIATVQGPVGLAVDRDGNLILSENANARIFRLNLSSGVSTLLAGGGVLSGRFADGQPARNARLNSPAAVAVDAANRVWFTDAGDNLVRVIQADGTLQTIAGRGTRGFSGDGGIATEASFREPWGIAVAPDGTVYVADSVNGRIRAILPTRPSFTTENENVEISVVSDGAPSVVNLPVNSSFTGLSCNVAGVNLADRRIAIQRSEVTAPGVIPIRVDPTGLAAGTLRGSFQLVCPAAQPPSRTVNLTLRVLQAAQPKLAAGVPAIQAAVYTGSDRVLQQIPVRNAGSGTLNLSVATETATGGSWLSAEAPAALAASNAGTVDVWLNPAVLGPGTYNGTVTLTGASPEDVVRVPVRLTINASEGRIAVSHRALTFTTVAGGGAPLAQEFLISNAGTGNLVWQTRSKTLAGGEWLRVNTDSGRTPATGASSPVEVSVAPGSLGAGTYYGQVQIFADGVPNSPQSVTVVLNVVDASENPGPEVRPVSLSFSSEAGGAPGAQIVRIANLGARPLSYTSTRSGWISLVPSAATLAPGETARLILQPDLAGLAPGNYDGAVDLRFDDGTSRKIGVGLIIPEGASAAGKGSERPAANCSATARVDFENGQQPFRVRSGQTINLAASVRDNCGNAVTPDRGSVRLAMQDSDPGGDLSHAGTGKWARSWQARSSAAGSRVKGALYVFLTKGVAIPVPVEIPIEVSVTAGGAVPLVEPGALRNAASFDAFSPVAPGMLISLIGQQLSEDPGVAAETEPLPTELNNTEVRLGDKPLRLLFSSSGQINAQVPYDLTPETEHQVLVRRGTALSVPEGFIVASAAPAIFAADASGSGQAAAENLTSGGLADSSSPLKAGDKVRIFCTGLGRVTPEIEPGLPAPLDTEVRTVATVGVTIGGVPAEVVFSGLSPGVAGRYQVDAIVPEGVAAGDAVPVVVSAGPQSSKPLTVAVR